MAEVTALLARWPPTTWSEPGDAGRVTPASGSTTAQCAAVTTTSGEINVPEQKPELAPARRISTVAKICSVVAAHPPTTFSLIAPTSPPRSVAPAGSPQPRVMPKRVTNRALYAFGGVIGQGRLKYHGCIKVPRVNACQGSTISLFGKLSNVCRDAENLVLGARRPRVAQWNA
jgi:hypothetical protein